MAHVRHGTLVANTVADIDIQRDAVRVEVLNRDGGAEIFFTVDGAAPTVEGANCHCLPAAIGALEVEAPAKADTHVKMISLGTPKYSVRKVR